MFLFKMLVFSVDKLGWICRNILQVGHSDKNKMHLKRCCVVCEAQGQRRPRLRKSSIGGGLVREKMLYGEKLFL